MTPILERRLDALGRQAVADAVAPAPTSLLRAVAERQATRNALRVTISCSAVACFLLTGLAAYLMLPAPTPVRGLEHPPVVHTDSGTAGEPLAPKPVKPTQVAGTPAQPGNSGGTAGAENGPDHGGNSGPSMAADRKERKPE